MKTKLIICLACLLLLAGCARPDIRKRLYRKAMPINHCYLISVYAVPKALFLRSDMERTKWFFDHAKEVRGKILMEPEDLKWILDNW